MSDQLRRAHQCHHDGCDSEARWQLWLAIECIGVGRDRLSLKCESSIKVCDAHTDRAVQFMLAPGNKSRIAVGLAHGGYPLPDFNSAVPIFAPLEATADEARKLHA